MSFAVLPIAEAASFTLGCMAIHALRRHADAVTATLACVATLLILLIGVACAPESVAKYQTSAIGEFSQLEVPVY